MSESLSALPNIGAVLEEQLNRVGVRTPETLRRLGSREAWLRIRDIDPTACLHKLQALEGAVRGVRKNELPESAKNELRTFFEAYRISGAK
ncbi:TfoX/Sxy family protein [Fretibacterium sp. OH1220_COT-178]|uniref:TfoX/Sxy family protein n=1 Tax=Fretibacterium sp. OH1220_COT-178 TaxID=2491047 RepID=UPI000F603370|nr:TfoX/Sxy family protein [Fretibacterium sp. OH1220_COT-178]RRD66028.1 competence protein TfoX [Fretibacterium sp. OH1220_COT-178]